MYHSHRCTLLIPIYNPERHPIVQVGNHWSSFVTYPKRWRLLGSWRVQKVANPEIMNTENNAVYNSASYQGKVTKASRSTSGYLNSILFSGQIFYFALQKLPTWNLSKINLLKWKWKCLFPENKAPKNYYFYSSSGEVLVFTNKCAPKRLHHLFVITDDK